MKVIRKSLRLSRRVYDYINGYRGDNFCQRLDNYVLDTEERRDLLVLQWEQLEAEIQRKQRKLDELNDLLQSS